jgi:hypothetical protein
MPKPKLLYRTRGSDALLLLAAERRGPRGVIAKRLRKTLDRSVLNRARKGERKASAETQEKIAEITGGLIPVAWWKQKARGRRRCITCGRPA